MSTKNKNNDLLQKIKRDFAVQRKKFSKFNPKQKIIFVAGIFAVVFFTLLAFSSVFLQKSLREADLDSRRDASTPKGIVEVTSPNQDDIFTAGEEEGIVLQINTKRTQTNGIQIGFDILGDITSPVLRGSNVKNLDSGIVAPHQSLEIVSQQVSAINGGYHVEALLLPIDIGGPFATNYPTSFLQIVFTPQQNQDIDVVFDPNVSIVTQYQTSFDILKHITAMTFQVGEEPLIPVCTAPANLVATSLSCNNEEQLTAVLSWPEVAGATQYAVQYSRDPDFNSPIVEHLVNSTTFSINNVADGTWYARVRVSDADNCVADPVSYFYTTTVFSQECTTETPECTYGFGEWSACESGWQTRAYSVQPANCPAPDENTLRQPCSVQCEYIYSEWSECVNGWQGRNYTTTEDCTWYESRTLEELVRACEVEDDDPDNPDTPDTPDQTNLFVYNYEACWYGDSGGISSYFYWDPTKIENVTTLEVSRHSDFRTVASKNVQDDVYSWNNYYLTTGTNLKWNDTDQDFSFSPGTVYYVRVHNGTEYSLVATFTMPQCSGTGGTSYRQCNEGCAHSSECAPDLACYNGICRHAGNVTSDICARPPDNGLNRTCNEYCADTNECASGYTCWWNRCRLPSNLDDLSCAAPVTPVYNYQYYAPIYMTPRYVYTDSYTKGAEVILPQGCNEYCANNKECAPNHRCYQNQCRHALNPESTVCDPYAVVGGKGDTSQDSNPTQDQEKDESELSSTPSTDEDDESSITNLSPTKKPVKPIEEQTAIDALKEYISNALDEKSNILVVGIILLIVGLLIFILSKLFGNKPVAKTSSFSKPYNPSRPPSSTLTTATKYKKPLASPATSTPVKPVQAASQPPVTAPVRTFAQSPAASKPTASQAPINPRKPVVMSQAKSSPMMSKVQQKGIKPPKS